MNIYQKLMEIRVELQKKGLKKSGRNAYAGYSYYELGDFLPPLMELEKANGVCSMVTFDATNAVLTLVNTDKPDEQLQFTSPMADAQLKGAHAIQNLGAVETYQRRYLYMVAYEIVEADMLDATQGKERNREETAKAKPKKTSKLNAENSARLNSKIKEYCELMNEKPAPLMQLLTMKLGFDVRNAEDKDVDRIIAAIDEEIPF